MGNRIVNALPYVIMSVLATIIGVVMFGTIYGALLMGYCSSITDTYRAETRCMRHYNPLRALPHKNFADVMHDG